MYWPCQNTTLGLMEGAPRTTGVRHGSGSGGSEEEVILQRVVSSVVSRVVCCPVAASPTCCGQLWGLHGLCPGSLGWRPEITPLSPPTLQPSTHSRTCATMARNIHLTSCKTLLHFDIWFLVVYIYINSWYYLTSNVGILRQNTNIQVLS